MGAACMRARLRQHAPARASLSRAATCGSFPFLQVEQLEVEQGADQAGVIPFHAPPLTDSPAPPRVNGTAALVRRRAAGAGSVRVLRRT